MSRIEITCPVCHKHKAVVSESTVGKSVRRVYECGHTHYIKQRALTLRSGFRWACLDCQCWIGKTKLDAHYGHNTVEVPIGRDPKYLKLWKYQQEGVQFIEQSGYTCVLADDTGLGKSAQSIMSLRYGNPEELFPVLIICPAGLTPNWKKECRLWLKDKFNSFEYTPLVHENTTGKLMPDMNIHIISNMRISSKSVKESIKEYGFKTIIVDEAHNFKNDAAKRTQTLISIAKDIPNRILLSATPVVNRTTELFNLFHIVAPQEWPHKGYLTAMCIRSDEGKPLSIAPWYRDALNNKIKGYYLRRTKKDLWEQLPPKIINNVYLDLTSNKNYVTAYNDILTELEKRLQEFETNAGSYMFILALIVKAWQFTAVAKTPAAIEHIKEHLEWSDEKIAIGTHHVAPREHIKKHLPCDFAEISAQTPQIKQEQEDEFRSNPNKRVLVASILGAGEGRNLQFCKNVVFLERFWNPAKEIQFQDRFYIRGKNPDEPLSEKDSAIITYLLAENTIDEFFTEMVALKAEIASAATEKDYFADEGFVIELARKVITKRLKYVGA